MGTKMTESDNLQLDYNTMNNIKTFTPVYHDDEDTFFLRPEKPHPATSVDWNGEIWVRIDPTNGEVVGLEIEDFEMVFLKKHPEIAAIKNVLLEHGAIGALMSGSGSAVYGLFRDRDSAGKAFPALSRHGSWQVFIVDVIL